MRRQLVIRSLGIASAALGVLWWGTRPPIHASQAPESAVSGGFAEGATDHISANPVAHLAAKPMSLEATRIWLKLQEKVPMAFPNDTPLGDVLKFIKESTKDKDHFPEGIPIYLDPVGLNDADKTPNSPVSIELAGVPLATTLRLLLKQIGLHYRVDKDGFLQITSPSSDEMIDNIEGMILDNIENLRMDIDALRREVRGLRGGGTRTHPTPPGSPPAGIGGGMGSKGGMM